MKKKVKASQDRMTTEERFSSRMGSPRPAPTELEKIVSPQ